MKKKIIAIVAVLLIGLGIGVVIYLNQPKVVVRNALAGVANDLLKRDEIKPLVKMMEKGSLEVSAQIDTEQMYGPIYGDRYIGRKIDASVGGKLYFGKRSLFFKNVCADVSVPWENIDFSINADLYVGSDYLYISEDDLLGGAVGMIRGEMADSLKNSELAREMPEELYYELMPAMKNYDSLSEKQKKKNDKLFTKCLGHFLFAIEEHAIYEAQTQEVALDGESVKSRVITVTLDQKAMAAALNDFYDRVRDDEELAELTEQYGWLVQLLLGTFEVMPEVAEADDFYGFLMASLENAIEKAEDSPSQKKWTMEVVTPRLSSTLRCLTLSVEEDGEAQELFSLDLGKDGVKKTDRITLDLKEERYCFEISQNHSAQYQVELTKHSKASDECVLLFSLALDKDAETFELFRLSSESPASLRGTWKEESGKTEIVVESFCDAEGFWIDEGFEIRLIFDQKDSMPKPIKQDDVRNLFDLTLDDVKEIIAKSKNILKFIF